MKNWGEERMMPWTYPDVPTQPSKPLSSELSTTSFRNDWVFVAVWLNFKDALIGLVETFTEQHYIQDVHLKLDPGLH